MLIPVETYCQLPEATSPGSPGPHLVGYWQVTWVNPALVSQAWETGPSECRFAVGGRTYQANMPVGAFARKLEESA